MKNILDLQIPCITTTELFTFSHVFQPIFSLEKGHTYGYESLIRGNLLKNPQLLFSIAERQGKLFNLDISSVTQSILSFNQSVVTRECDFLLTVNVFPSTIIEPSFPRLIEELMKKVHIPPKRIIFEFNETETIENLNKLQEMKKFLKEQGFQIALDDLGKGQSSLRAALELEPDMVKLDQYFCKDLENSIKKQRFLEWITSYFKEAGTFVTLEGIEKDSQLTIAKQVGVHFGQGYHLGRPQPLNFYL